MIITRTPFRVSFFGGGTDYPSWFRSEGGAVLSTSINKYCWITCRRFPPFFPNSFRIVWSHIEPVSGISEILHPAVREGLRMMDFDDSQGVELHHQGDLPARSGMGSSSAFANGLILALSTLKGTSINKFELFAKAIELEQSWIKDNVGSQDQVATAVGGFNLIQFQQDGGIAVSPVAANRQTFSNLNDRLMLFYTGGTRTASVVVESFVSNLHERKVQLNRMRDMAFEARRILVDETDLDGFGELLDEGWRLKRQLGSRISTDVIDDVYSRARAAGALGGKLLGAGGAGFMLLYVRPENQPEVRSALSSLIHVPFRFETEGATLLMRSGGAEVD